MKTIITRLFKDAATAQSAAARLVYRGLPKRDCTIIGAGDRADAMMARAHVHASAIDAYSKHLGSGHVVLAVAATYKPLGAARMTREVLAKYDTVDCGDIVEEASVPWQPEHAPSVLKDHPLFLSVPGIEAPKHITGILGMPMLKAHKTKRSLMSGDRRMSRMFWPMKLVSQKRSARSVMRSGRRMSRMFWPMPLISQKPRRKSVMPGGGLPFSQMFGMRTLTLRK